MNVKRRAFVLLVFGVVAVGQACGATDKDALETLVARMARIGRTFSPSFSPDGRRLAVVSDLSGVPQIWIVSTAGGWPEQITAFDDPVTSVRWSPDGQWLAFSMAPGGGLNAQVYVIRPDGTGQRRLTGGGKENAWLGEWTHDGRALTLASNRRDAAGVDVYLADPVSGSMEQINRGAGFNFPGDVSDDGKRAVVYRQVSRGDNDLFLVSMAEGREVRVTPHQPVAEFSPGRFAGDSVYFTSNRDQDRSAFVRVRIAADGTPGPFEVLAARDDAEMDEFEINHAGSLAALLWNVDGRSQLAFLDLKTLQSLPGPELPTDLATGLAFSRDDNQLVLTLSGSNAPLDVWVIDLKTRNFRQVTRSSHPGVDLGGLVRPMLVRFAAHDGLEISGWMYLPRDFKAPGPIVLSFHGGPEGQERPAFRSDYQALLTRGIAVFAPNVRGSSGFGKKFVNLDNGALRVNGVRDILSCVDYAVRSGLADPKRVGIMGGSYGGYMVMAGLTEFPDRFAAGANLFGVVNFKTFFAHTEPWMAAISKVEYGDPEKEPEMLARLSPIHHVDRVIAPTIVLHGANDTNVPVVEAEQVVENLRKRHIPVEYVLFPDEGHGWRKTANRIKSTVAITHWFSRYLVEQAK